MNKPIIEVGLDNMEEKKIDQSISKGLVSQIINEIDSYKTATVPLSIRASFNMYQTVQNIITHQNKEFLNSLSAEDEKDGIKRDFFDIITPMVETTVSNIDLDSNDIEVYTDDPNYQAQEYLGSCLLRQYLRQTNHGETINENEYHFVDDGNIFVRFIEEKNRRDSGDIYRRIMPQNIIVTDPTAENLEQTDFIEKTVMSQSEVRGMSWENKKEVFELCTVGDNQSAPYYEVFYRYGEVSKSKLGAVIKEVHNRDYDVPEGEGDSYVQSLVVMVRAKTGAKNQQGEETLGVIVFAEELKPKEYKITKKLKITRYKPLEIVRYGKYNGRLWGEGYREIGATYQNRANEIANQLAEAMEIAKTMIFWSPDDKIAGRNVLSSVKMGQILKADNLGLLNNVFPNLSLFAEEWNRNITECQKALKAFEVATGENLPSSTSATAISVQNLAVGKYFNFKRERFGLFMSRIFKRWVMPELLRNIDENEAVEITGEATFIEDIIDAYVNGWILENIKDIALAVAKGEGSVPTQENIDQLKEMKKQEILRQPKLYADITKDFFDSIEMYVGINITGEAFNKQAKISNAMQLLNLELNPALQSNPDAIDTINWIKQMLGLKVRRSKQKAQMLAMPQVPGNPGDMNSNPNPGMPMKEPAFQPTQNV